MLASKNGNLTAAKLLLDAEATVDLQDKEGKTALILTSSSRIVELLLKSGAKVDLQDHSGQSALMVAAKWTSGSIAGLLLKHGALVELQDKEGKTALIFACEAYIENWTMKYYVEQLLNNYGAQVDKQDNSGQSVLMAISKYGTVVIAKVLLNAGAQVDLRDNDGKTALIIACQGCSSESTLKGFVELLLQHGAQVNLQDSLGQSALMIASEEGFGTIVELLLKNGAQVHLQDDTGQTALLKASKKEIMELLLNWDTQINESKLVPASMIDEGVKINQQDNKGRTVLITASKHGQVMLTDLLLERGANTDLQDQDGYSALMTACENGHFQIASRLLDEDADTFLKNNHGNTAFDLAMANRDTKILALFNKLRGKPSYPGIFFSEGVKRATITTTETNIDLEEVGISLSIPENSLSSTDPPLELQVQPCFSGPFVLPEDVELVSPVYIVKPSRRVAFQKEVLVKIWHHANLETEGDCEDMVFLSADTSPEYRGDTPVYVFKKIRGAKGSFRPGEEQPVGHIALKHFCLTTVGKNRKRKRRKEEDEDEGTKSKQIKGNLYSARLYRAIERRLIFCICLYQPLYLKKCNQVMAVQCKTKKIDPTAYSNQVDIISSEVRITQTCASGWAVSLKKLPASIKKREIVTQETYKMKDLVDFPPKVEIDIQSVPSQPNTGSLQLHVEGLDEQLTFSLQPGDIVESMVLPKDANHSSQPQQVDTSSIKYAVGDLKEEIQEQCKNPTANTSLLPTVCEMVTMMDMVEQLLQCSNSSDSVISLMIKLDEMEKKSQRLREEVKQILQHLKIKCDVDLFVERANTLAVQMRKVYTANMTHSNTPEWQSAVGLFVTNAANLMKAIKDALRASKLAQMIPNNYLPISSLTSPQEIPPSSPAMISADVQLPPSPRDGNTAAPVRDAEITVPPPHLPTPRKGFRSASPSQPEAASNFTSATNKCMMEPSLSKLALFRWRSWEGKQLEFRLINEVSAKWRDMGRMLDMNTDKLDSRTHYDNTESCWCVFSHWIDRNHACYPPTWRGLYTLLCDVQKVTVAHTMKEALETHRVQF